jgi:hypothetical protein
MEKWADYLISAVRYEKFLEGLKISHVKVHKDDGLKISSGQTWTRNEILDAMFNGKSFSTIFRDEKGNWKKGRSVHIKKEDSDFIITDTDDQYSDVLYGIQEL